MTWFGLSLDLEGSVLLWNSMACLCFTAYENDNLPYGRTLFYNSCWPFFQLPVFAAGQSQHSSPREQVLQVGPA